MGLKVVCIGGGTGLPNLLRGLKHYTENITAIVTVADDGGSSGRLRNELNIPPPGDIRNCLLALADTEPFMEQLFQYRFNEGALKGHSFGNLFIAAMTEMLGNFEYAIKESSNVLAVRGRVLPSTLEDVTIEALYEDGDMAHGESKIPNSRKKISRVFLRPENVKPLRGVLEAIETAEAIIIGPGSLYTSIMPNLLIRELTECISRSKAKKIFVINVMTQPGETQGYTAADHVRALVEHSSRDVLEYVVINNEQIPEYLVNIYKQDNAEPVLCDAENIERMGYNVVTGKILNPTDVVRHSPDKLASLIMSIVTER